VRLGREYSYVLLFLEYDHTPENSTADFTRYAPSAKAQYVQLIVIPIAFTFCAFVGIACTSAGYVHYGDYYWDPLRSAFSSILKIGTNFLNTA
jgi:cytosine/uracil/thiamine/allantoin permease